MKKSSLLNSSRGAFIEVFDAEAAKILDNILDPNTDPKAKRTITLKMEFSPSKDRSNFDTKISVNSKPAPVAAVETSFSIAKSIEGDIFVQENIAQMVGQINLNGEEQEQPQLIKIKVGG